MKYQKILLIFGFIGLLWGGCRKDYFQSTPQIDLSDTISFHETIIPIFNDNCSVPTCHTSGGETPDLTELNAYSQLVDLAYVDTTDDEGSLLYQRITATTDPMPPGGPLTPTQIAQILAWIKQGALDN